MFSTFSLRMCTFLSLLNVIFLPEKRSQSQESLQQFNLMKRGDGVKKRANAEKVRRTFE